MKHLLLANKEPTATYINMSIFSKKEIKNWLSDEDVLFQILNRISSISINQPYPKDPSRYLKTTLNHQPFLIYRQNHGVTHAIRKWFYMDYLLHHLPFNQSVSQVIKKMNHEERMLLKLAAFCERIGRLNEDSASLGSHHLFYSAEIFQCIADQLSDHCDFIQQLKKAIVEQDIPHLIDDEKDNTTYTTSSMQLMVLDQLLKATHCADLVRCWDSKGDSKYTIILNKLMSYLRPLLASVEDALFSAKALMTYAGNACLATGNKVHLHEPVQGKLHFDSNYRKPLMARCTNDVRYGFRKISHIQTKKNN